MNTDENLKIKWKMIRDKNLRKYKSEIIEKEIKRREPDKQKYILSQMQYADIIFSYLLKPNKNINDEINEKDLKLKISLESDVILDELLEDFEKIDSLKFDHDYSIDLKKQEIVLEGEISNDHIVTLAKKNINNLSEIITAKAIWHNNYRGLRQLFILLMINNQFKN